MSAPLALSVWGDLRSPTAKAEQARRTVAALVEAGVDVRVAEPPSELGRPYRPVTPAVDALPRGGGAALALHLDEARVFDRMPNAVVHPLGSATHAIGAWTWDLPSLSYGMVFPLHKVDEVWVGSTFVQDVFRRGTDRPVHVVPPIVEGPARPAHGRAHFGLWEGPTLFVSVLTSPYETSNPFGVLDAYERAFPPRDRGSSTLLVLAVRGLTDRPELAEELQQRAGALRVRLLHDLDDAETSSLLGLADAVVSLHRAEATGLTLFEAMRQGTPVVSTAYGAPLDVCTPTTSRQVGYVLGAVTGDHFALDPVKLEHWVPGTRWAEPDLDQAAAWLRQLHDHPHEAARLGAAGAREVAERLSSAAVAAVMTARLQELQDETATLARRTG